MKPEAYKQLRRVEDGHWWYRSGRDQIARLVKVCWPVSGLGRVLDAGCGTGGTTAWLRRYGEVVGVDIHQPALVEARKRGLAVVCAAIDALPFAAGTFDMIVTLDVLYHNAVRDPVEALRELARVATAQGRLIMRAPALQALAGAHDEFVGGARRFRLGEAEVALENGGWNQRWAGYVNMILLIPAFLARKLGRGSAVGDLDGSARAGVIFYPLLSIETKLVGRARLPAGTSVLAAAEKR